MDATGLYENNSHLQPWQRLLLRQAGLPGPGTGIMVTPVKKPRFPSRPAMTRQPAAPRPQQKTELHPRNRHRHGYDFAQLVRAEPALAGFVGPNRYGNVSIDFANPDAVKLLNRALLRQDYGVADWQIPPQYLCPPVPGRVDYLHYAADLLAADQGGVIPRGENIRVLDIGCGANLIYPLLGQHEYGWRFVGADIDAPALANAAGILRANPQLAARIELRQQQNAQQIFTGIIRAEERFDLTLCNPPFHASLAEARAGTARKLRGLAASAGSTTKRPPRNAKTALNFGGQAAELSCPGGEATFISRMIVESVAFATQVRWFSTLVSKESNLPGLYRALAQAGVVRYETLAMAQGQKQSRVLAWTFWDEKARRR